MIPSERDEWNLGRLDINAVLVFKNLSELHITKCMPHTPQCSQDMCNHHRYHISNLKRVEVSTRGALCRVGNC